MKLARGFTLIELLLTITITGILATMAVWGGSQMLQSWRVSSAAQELILDMRSATSLVARLNRRVVLIVDHESASRCTPSYRLQTVPNVGEDPIIFKEVCFPQEYPGVVIGNSGLIAADVTCPDDGLALKNCSLCAGTQVINAFPSGEVATPSDQPNGASIVFTSSDRPSLSRTAAVGIRDTSGRARLYRPNADGTAWTCP